MVTYRKLIKTLLGVIEDGENYRGRKSEGRSWKTTTSVNLAAALAVAEMRVLLIDIDPQANATSGVGIQRGSFRRSLYNILVLDEPISNVLLNTEIQNLKVLPADKI